LKNGFTLIELLTVIAILGLIMIIAVPSVFAIQNSIQKRSYCNKIDFVESSARLYGRDIIDDLEDGPKEVTVRNLVRMGYLKKDNNDAPYTVDPRDNSSMDDDVIKIGLKNKKVYVYYVDVDSICPDKTVEFDSGVTIPDLDDEPTVPIEPTDPTNLLGEAILAQGGGSAAIESKGNPAFTAIPTAVTSGIYATEDEYGTSYYYRGERNSLNNNLIFAGFQWKIVRINGDGSIRLIYNGTEEQFNGNGTMNTTGIDTQIGVSAFNAGFNDNRYMGYMYGSTSTTKEGAQTNTNNSIIKTYIDNWYANNIITKGSDVTEKIADNLFCNDRQLGRDYPGAPTTGSGWNGTGAGASVTYYAAYYRHIENRNNPTPTLKCAQKNDRFTVSDVAIGNGDLTYPVGLVTADEIAYAGNTYNYYNTNQYLVTSMEVWSLSPEDMFSSEAFIGVLHSSGPLRSIFVSHSICGVRPILNLNSDVRVTGSGSATDPFVVVD